MVVVRIVGGMGNQLFQYAMGRRISVIHKVPLKLDVTAFDRYYGRHKYVLGNFNIIGDLASEEIIERLRKTKLSRGLFHSLKKRLLPYYKHHYVREKSYRYDPALSKVPKDVYLEGSWQSEKYFRDISDVIRDEFTVKHEPDKKSKQIARAIGKCDSVSVHVRRGDYVDNGATSRIHGTCSLDYYKRAMEIIADEVRNPRIFLFSDDAEWARKHIRLELPTTYVDHNGVERSYEDLRLMSLCRCHVTANSTFSWWGAWLSEYPDKIVITPKRWFKDSSFESPDRIPEKWLRV